MKVLMMLGMASAIAIAAASPAQARQGCGPGFHRGLHGMCRPNARQRVFVVGRYYPGRGYWYNSRWYHGRYRHNHVWGYR